MCVCLCGAVCSVRSSMFRGSLAGLGGRVCKPLKWAETRRANAVKRHKELQRVEVPVTLGLNTHTTHTHTHTIIPKHMDSCVCVCVLSTLFVPLFLCVPVCLFAPLSSCVGVRVRVGVGVQAVLRVWRQPASRKASHVDAGRDLA